MKKCPVLLVVSGFLTENDISWFNRIKAGCGLDVRYYCHQSPSHLKRVRPGIMQRKQQLITEKN